MLTFVRKVVGAIGRRLLNFSINEDKAVGNVILGTPQDETISGWSGANEKTNPVADALAKLLDTVHFAGNPHHAEDAAKVDMYMIQARNTYDNTIKQGSD